MSETNETLKKAMIQALEKHLGIVVDACKAVGINRVTHYRWLKSDDEYRQEVESINEVSLDFVESKLFERIRGIEMAKIGSDGEVNTYSLPPDTTAIIFYLKTKGKNRGYIEHSQPSNEVKVNVNIKKKPKTED